MISQIRGFSFKRTMENRIAKKGDSLLRIEASENVNPTSGVGRKFLSYEIVFRIIIVYDGCTTSISEERTMTLAELYQKVLTVHYIQLKERSASFAYEREGETLYLYFEGSNGATDWRTNFNFPAKPYREMKNLWFAHRGFLAEWKVIKERLESQIADKSVRRIIIAGYSHGGALALLCHEYCVFHREDIAKSIYGYGFGAPRVVFLFLGKTLRRRLEHFFVVRNCRDLVTHLPPLVFGFRQAGNLLHIGKGEHYGAISSHYPQNYQTELKKLSAEVCPIDEKTHFSS